MGAAAALSGALVKRTAPTLWAKATSMVVLRPVATSAKNKWLWSPRPSTKNSPRTKTLVSLPHTTPVSARRKLLSLVVCVLERSNELLTTTTLLPEKRQAPRKRMARPAVRAWNAFPAIRSVVPRPNSTGASKEIAAVAVASMSTRLLSKATVPPFDTFILRRLSARKAQPSATKPPPTPSTPSENRPAPPMVVLRRNTPLVSASTPLAPGRRVVPMKRRTPPTSRVAKLVASVLCSTTRR